MYGITSLKTDIILLCDIRLCNSAGISNLNELTTSFKINPHCSYKFFHNSRINKRGVGILIKHSLSFAVLGERRDPEDNYLALHLEIEGKKFTVCSVYGPNQVQPTFFTSLQESISFFANYPVIMGGDWNCTVSCEPANSNIDTLNMQNPPNIRHSNLLKKLCTDLNLSDPFRVKFPFRKEYTFFSKDVTKKNKSRIDFFVISYPLLARVNKIFVQPHMQNKMFDHRAVIMCFKDPPKVIKQPTISRDLIKDPDIELHVSLVVADTYLIHTNALDNQELQRLTYAVGNAKMNIGRAGPDKKYFHDGYRTEEEENTRAALIGSIHELLDSFPIEIVQRGGFREELTDDIFLETLINNIRNECISYQIFLAKTILASTKHITDKLKVLKTSYVANEAEINSLEKKLDEIVDNQLRNRLEAPQNFEILQNEKITPFFLNLAKGNKAEASLTDLLDDDGNPFRTDTELKEHIRKFYQNIYKKPNIDNFIQADCITNFLGEEICNSNLVKDSIIPEQIRQEFEEMLSIQELDESAAQGNRSAAGMDGINNCFIKKFWHLLRIPLHRYIPYCHERGFLTQSFRTASIKLIPKKGDCTKIKNWRPISLLSCLYKVISRALNNRLKKVSGIIFSRGQKGFTKDRHIQEVLMNLIEMIAHCKEYNIPGAILSIDTAKAVDSVSHRYMHYVYSFFGFGPNFIKLLETLGNNRTACIAFEDGSHSAEIALECGRAQGNTSSPVEYNMAQQIVIFKIELCPEVRNVYQIHFIARPFLRVPVPALPVVLIAADMDDQRFRNESSFETSKADGFADDNTTGTLFKYQSLNAIKKNIARFLQY